MGADREGHHEDLEGACPKSEKGSHRREEAQKPRAWAVELECQDLNPVSATCQLCDRDK